MKFLQAGFKFWQTKISEKRERASKMTNLMHRQRSHSDCSQSHLKPSHNSSSFRWVFQQCIFQAWDHASIASSCQTHWYMSLCNIDKMVNRIECAEEGSDSDFFQSYPRKSYIIAGLKWFFQQCFSLWIEMMLPEFSSCQNCCMWVCAIIIKMVNCMHRSRSNSDFLESNLKPFYVVYSSLRCFFPARFFKAWDHASREFHFVKSLEFGSLCKNIVGNIWWIIRASYKNSGEAHRSPLRHGNDHL